MQLWLLRFLCLQADGQENERERKTTDILYPGLQIVCITFSQISLARAVTKSHLNTKQAEKFRFLAFPRKGNRTGEHAAHLHHIPWLSTYLLFYFHTLSFINISYTRYLWKNGTMSKKFYLLFSIIFMVLFLTLHIESIWNLLFVYGSRYNVKYLFKFEKIKYY